MAEINLSGPPHHSSGRCFLGFLLGLLRTDLNMLNLEKSSEESRIISAEDGTVPPNLSEALCGGRDKQKYPLHQICMKEGGVQHKTSTWGKHLLTLQSHARPSPEVEKRHGPGQA